MNKTNLGIIIIVAITGIAVGFFMQRGFEYFKATSEIKDVANKYSGLDIGPCLVIPEGVDRKTASSTCLNNILFTYALEHRDILACQDIGDSLIKQDCEARVLRLQNLTAEEDRFCQGAILDSLCRDLTLTLLASEIGDVNTCYDIQNESQRSNCLSLVKPAGASRPELLQPPAQEIGENGLPVPQFGLNCLPGDKACAKALPVFNKAVLSLQSSLCEGLGIFAQACLDELALYRSFQEGDSGYCEQRQPKEICEIDLTTARALEVQDSIICRELENVVAAEACRITVESAKDKRFDYLLQSP